MNQLDIFSTLPAAPAPPDDEPAEPERRCSQMAELAGETWEDAFGRGTEPVEGP